MKRDLKFLVIVALFGLGVFDLRAVAQVCPGCAAPSSFIPISNSHGTGPNGGRIVTICMDNSTQEDNNQNPTPGSYNSALYFGLTGTHGAMAFWNAATNGGASSGYYLQWNCTNPDITLSYTSHIYVGGAHCARTQSGRSGNQVTSANITVSEWLAQSTNPDDIASALAHEIGHVFGLSDATTCGATVMGGATGSGATGTECVPQYPVAQPGTSPIRSNDVQAAQNVINRSSQCKDAYQSTQSDGGSPCTGGTPTCINSTPFCNTNATPPQWACANGEQPCIPPQPPPCCQNCYIYCTAGGWYCQGSPITIDVSGVGFHFTDVAGGVQFRVMPGQQLRQMSWPDALYGNGWLVLDRNGNGQIDDFTELFGNATPQPTTDDPNGYLALSVFDEPANGGNGNGMIDPEDSVYDHLRIWIDENHNGISEPNELHTLQEAGVFRIDLHYVKARYTDENGNIFRYKSRVWDRATDRDKTCYDVFVQIDMNHEESGH